MYWIHKPDTHLVIETDRVPEQVAERLSADVTRVKSVVWSPAFGARTSFVAVVDLPTLEMRVKHGYSNGFTRLLYGTIQPHGTGSRLELSFRSIWWIELLVRLIEVFLLGPLVAYSIALLLFALRGGEIQWTPVLVWACTPLLTVALLAGIEIFARALGDRDEQHMRTALLAWFPPRSG